MAPYTSPSITVAGSIRSLTQQSVGGVSDVGSLPFPTDEPVAT